MPPHHQIGIGAEASDVVPAPDRQIPSLGGRRHRLERAGGRLCRVVVEPTGADTQLYCRFNGQEVTATISDRADCKPGDRINLAPDLRRAHLFDAATGSRLVA